MDLPSSPTPPLSISIVGAGIAGLTTAITLRRNGHLVKVLCTTHCNFTALIHSQLFEASKIKTEIGAALGVQPNALRVLDHLGVCRDNLKGVLHSGVRIFNVSSES
jgi:salicylate hydroxylase